MKTFGYTKRRTNRDLNEIVLHDTYAEIILYNEDQIEEARAPIDIEDVEKCKIHRWNLTVEKYVANHAIGRLHNYVMNFKPPKDKSKVVNHIDRDIKLMELIKGSNLIILLDFLVYLGIVVIKNGKLI